MLKLFACHRSKPSDYQKEVNSTSETALQRAIFNNGKTTIDLGEIEWLDLELPVDLERGGRGHCPDLLGKIGSRMVICELKFNTHSNNMKPQDAEIEVQGYYKKIVENHVELDRFGNLHRANCKSFNWSDFAKDDVIRIIAADQNYWGLLDQSSESKPTSKYSLLFDSCDSKLFQKSKTFICGQICSNDPKYSMD